MKVEIWSDIACPFCYIGKRNFEGALEKFAHKDKVEVEWKSFQLDPYAEIEQSMSAEEMLSSKYRVSVDEAKKMNQRVTNMAKDAGLDFNLSGLKLTNTFDAHRLIHLAKKHGLQDKAEETLFSAYLIQGEHVGRKDNLVKIGTEIGLNEDEVKQMLESDLYTKEVKEDMQMAQMFQISGVPFFVVDRKYGISGAQPSEHFLEVLKDTWSKEHQTLETIAGAEGAVCGPDGVCS